MFVPNSTRDYGSCWMKMVIRQNGAMMFLIRFLTK